MGWAITRSTAPCKQNVNLLKPREALSVPSASVVCAPFHACVAATHTWPWKASDVRSKEWQATFFQLHFRPFHYSVVPHIEMLDNLFYVDKDILEARARGDADLLEVPHSCLTIGREIGKGAFGRVYIARADNINGIQGSQVVAVKKLKSLYFCEYALRPSRFSF